MELIIKTYGKFLVETAVAALFFLLIFTGIRDEEGNIGVFQILGGQWKETDTICGADFSVCLEESKRRMPEIFYKKDGALAAGNYELAELFGAQDCDGSALTVQIQEITYMGRKTEQVLDKESGRLYFSAAGEYMIQLCTTDAWNNMKISKIWVPVNGDKEKV